MQLMTYFIICSVVNNVLNLRYSSVLNLHWEVSLIILELSQYIDPITQDVTFSIEESLRLLCKGSLGRAKRCTPRCWRALRICGSFTIFKSILTVDLPIGRPRYCRSMRKARESSMALVLWRFVLAVVLSFCAVAVIAPRQAPAADVIVFLDQAKLMQLPDKSRP